MAVAWGTAASNGVIAAASTGVTVTKPTGLSTGDVLYAFVSKTSFADTNPFTCSGWTDIGTGTQGATVGGDRHLTILRKVITDGGGEPADYTFVTTSGTTSRIAGIIVRVTGADTATPEDITVPGYTFTSNDATPPSNAATTVTAGALVLSYCMLSLTAIAFRTWGPPPGYTDGISQNAGDETGADQQAGVAYKTMAAPGAVGTGAWTHSADEATIEAVVAVVIVRPAADSGPQQPMPIISRF